MPNGNAWGTAIIGLLASMALCRSSNSFFLSKSHFHLFHFLVLWRNFRAGNGFLQLSSEPLWLNPSCYNDTEDMAKWEDDIFMTDTRELPSPIFLAKCEQIDLHACQYYALLSKYEVMEASSLTTTRIKNTKVTARTSSPSSWLDQVQTAQNPFSIDYLIWTTGAGKDGKEDSKWWYRVASRERKWIRQIIPMDVRGVLKFFKERCQNGQFLHDPV